ncbi:MAG: hypothetical protein JWR84_4157 [Caulobacter sp.]|nr:hypothetical protein [Caulobacter sp.]
MHTLAAGFIGLVLMIEAASTDRAALFERVARAMPTKGLIGFVPGGGLDRESLSQGDPGLEEQIDQASARYDRCIDPVAGPDVLRRIVLEDFGSRLSDRDLADFAKLLESPDYAQLKVLLSGDLGAEMPGPVLEAAARVAEDPTFVAFAKATSETLGPYLARPEVEAAMAACDQALRSDLAAGGVSGP